MSGNAAPSWLTALALILGGAAVGAALGGVGGCGLGLLPTVLGDTEALPQPRDAPPMGAFFGGVLGLAAGAGVGLCVGVLIWVRLRRRARQP